jgi:hypothetical protein
MTTSDGPRSGPHIPVVGSGGLSHEWVIAASNAPIRCPALCPDRRRDNRGDRRAQERVCGFVMGRSGSHATAVRWKRIGQSAVLGSHVIRCEKCREPVEFLTVAAEAA